MYDKGDVIFVLRISSKEADPVPTFLGDRKTAYSTSTGKVLLAFNRSYLQETISRGLSKQGPNTITEINALKRELEDVKNKGYSISNNENDTSTYAIAAPIQSYSGETIASVNLVGPISYMKSVNTNKIIISKRLSKKGPNTNKEINALKRKLEDVKNKGYSISNNENDTSTYAIAAPIQSYSGETIASVNLVGPISYMKSVNTNQMITSIVNTGKAVSRELGYIEVM